MAKQDLAIRLGYATSTTIKVVGHSLVGADIVITVSKDGSTVSTLTLDAMTQLGTDGLGTPTEAFYYDSGVITGLSSFTTYTYTAVQSGNTISGSFTTSPSDTDDFCFFAGTCDGIGNINGDTTEAGMYTHMKDYADSADSLPIAGLIHCDDHYGYMDVNTVDDGTGVDGYHISGALGNSNSLVYELALGAGAALGLYDDAGSNFACDAGNNADRVWAMRNIPVWPQWGDHDGGDNETAWSTPKGASYTSAKVIWDAILRPLAPPDIDAGNSYAWGFTLGCVYMCAPDAITTGSGDAADGTAAPTTILGNAQIDSVLAAMNNTSPFKVLGLSNGIRHLNGTPGTNDAGAQNPLSLHATEYPRLFTADTGLMGLASTNGVDGTFFTLQGDYHGLKFQRNLNTDGDNAEDFYSINLGTLNGSANFDCAAFNGVTYSGTTVEYAEGASGGNDQWAVRFEVYGSKPNKEVYVFLMDKLGNDVFVRKFMNSQGNKAVTVGTAQQNGSPSISVDIE